MNTQFMYNCIYTKILYDRFFTYTRTVVKCKVPNKLNKKLKE